MKDIFIILTMIFSKEDDQWVGLCEELGVSQFGDSYEEAKEHLNEAVLLHLNTLEDLGESERFFKENNIKVYHADDEEITTRQTRFAPNTARVEQYKHSLQYTEQHSFV
ncbi:MAG: hypothetical protein A2V93_01625 [Ignavibacteria bacterium RBG_16_34_14]|nr:MAG: hypothetical protein A2V93_01625 [Ignavibacteria bacterium RBG_16_34_14]